MEDCRADFVRLLNSAKEASENSYSPYSNFPVGAACLFESGKVYKGANIENASYGLSICAERNALSTALTEGEKSPLVAVAVFSPRQKKCVPCGACRQWLAEFYHMHNEACEISVILEDGDGGVLECKLKDLLPHDFQID